MAKYNARPGWLDGYYFPSTKEMRRYKYLKLRLMAGQIEDLKVHPKYELLGKIPCFPRITYSPDFEYVEDGITITEDVKGMKSGVPYALFQLKKRLFYERYGRVVEEI